MSDVKSFLVVNRKAPYSTSYSKETLDVALMAAVFNQKTSLLYMDDGVYQLLKQQDPGDIKHKNSSQSLPMLEMYEVKDIYVEHRSLEARGLTTQDLVIPVKVVDSKAIAELIQQQDVVLGF